MLQLTSSGERLCHVHGWVRSSHWAPFQMWTRLLPPHWLHHHYLHHQCVFRQWKLILMVPWAEHDCEPVCYRESHTFLKKNKQKWLQNYANGSPMTIRAEYIYIHEVILYNIVIINITTFRVPPTRINRVSIKIIIWDLNSGTGKVGKAKTCTVFQEQNEWYIFLS